MKACIHFVPPRSHHEGAHPYNCDIGSQQPHAAQGEGHLAPFVNGIEDVAMRAFDRSPPVQLSAVDVDKPRVVDEVRRPPSAVARVPGVFQLSQDKVRKSSARPDQC
jgi:hypothetical protein